MLRIESRKNDFFAVGAVEMAPSVLSSFSGLSAVDAGFCGISLHSQVHRVSCAGVGARCGMSDGWFLGAGGSAESVAVTAADIFGDEFLYVDAAPVPEDSICVSASIESELPCEVCGWVVDAGRAVEFWITIVGVRTSPLDGFLPVFSKFERCLPANCRDGVGRGICIRKQQFKL